MLREGAWFDLLLDCTISFLSILLHFADFPYLGPAPHTFFGAKSFENLEFEKLKCVKHFGTIFSFLRYLKLLECCLQLTSNYFLEKTETNFLPDWLCRPFIYHYQVLYFLSGFMVGQLLWWASPRLLVIMHHVQNTVCNLHWIIFRIFGSLLQMVEPVWFCESKDSKDSKDNLQMNQSLVSGADNAVFESKIWKFHDSMQERFVKHNFEKWFKRYQGWVVVVWPPYSTHHH